jgi:UDP-N-acetylmuramate dehydrogenase
MTIEKELPGIKKNIFLKSYTTFKIGGPAKYFFPAKNKEDLILAIKAAKKNKLPFFILGGGSNLLVSDKGYKGLIIKLKTKKPKLKSKNQKSKIIETESGTSLSELGNLAFKNNLTGLEWAIGIPGTAGGAIWGNAGAFGKSMADIVKTVEVLNSESLRIKTLKNKDCKFAYRDSIFRRKKKLIILSALLQFKKSNKRKIKNKIEEYLKHRKETQPLKFSSTGSIFKNPQGFSAGELIEKCGLKGKKIENVKISGKHANFIVNLGRGKAKNVKKLIELIKKEVKNKFKINLEEEIQSLGF